MRDFLPPPSGPRKVKRLIPESYSREKAIVVIGKGPTARQVPTSSEYYTCCLNTSGRFTDYIDFQFLGDHQVFTQMQNIPGYFEKMKNFIMPIEFNQDNPRRLRSTQIMEGSLPSHINVHEYTFHFHPHPETDHARLYTVISTGELAAAWLLDEGFAKFYTVGIDPHAQPNIRHELFESNREGVGRYPNGPDGMRLSYERTMKRMKLFGASMEELT